MTRVRDIMNHGVISCSGDTVIGDVARTLVDSQIHATFVLDTVGRQVGVISDFDLLAGEWLGVGDSSLRTMRAVTAGELMSAPVETIVDSADIREAAQRMSQLRISRLLVCDGQNAAIGTVSIGDVVKAIAPHPTVRSYVRDVMSYAIVTCRSSASIHGAVRGMAERRSRSVVVTERGEPVGVLTGRDIVKNYAEGGAVDYGSSVSAVMSSPVVTVSPDLPLNEAADGMLDQEIHRLVVVDADGGLLGVISTSDIVSELAEDASAWRRSEART